MNGSHLSAPAFAITRQGKTAWLEYRARFVNLEVLI